MSDADDLLIDRDPIAYATHFLDLQARHPAITGSRTAIRALVVEAERLRAEAERLQATLATHESLLTDFVHPDDDCWYDHHGYCQAHGWMVTDPPCPHKRAKDLLADAASPHTPSETD